MMPLIRKGDGLSPFGGAVLAGHYSAFGAPVACKGDAARCSLHGATEIAEGAPGFIIDGQPVALHGHRCACGCQLISSLAASNMGVAP